MKSQIYSSFNAVVHHRINARVAAFALAGGLVLGGCSDRDDKVTPPVSSAASTPVPVPEKQGYPFRADPVVVPPPQKIVANSPAQQKIIDQAPVSRRGLTQGETKLLRSIFGNALDLANIEILFYNQTLSDTGTDVMEGDTRHIYVFGKKYASEDYSESKDGLLFSALVYEATRLWQNQTGRTWRDSDSREYAYTLDSQRRFGDYGLRQQAAIMEDYAARILHRSHVSHWMDEEYGKENCDADDYLIQLVEAQFPDAARAREALSETRPLTENEEALVKAFFGDQINTSIVRNVFSPRFCSDQAASVSDQSHIFYHGSEARSGDFAKDRNVYSFSIFMHEMTHIWQNQNNERYTNFRFVPKPDPYVFSLDITRWSFSDYGDEQQAAIIEDYVAYFLHPYHDTFQTRVTKSNIRQLRTLVENQFPGARKLREYYELHHKLPRPDRGAAGSMPQPAPGPS